MPKPTRERPTEKHTATGRRLIRSVKQAIAWASGEDVPIRVTMVSVERVPVIDGSILAPEARRSPLTHNFAMPPHQTKESVVSGSKGMRQELSDSMKSRVEEPVHRLCARSAADRLKKISSSSLLGPNSRLSVERDALASCSKESNNWKVIRSEP